MGIDLGPLTVLVPAQVGLGLEAGPGLARLVDRHHAELVPFSLARVQKHLTVRSFPDKDLSFLQELLLNLF
jgi:hypothetical protein